MGALAAVGLCKRKLGAMGLARNVNWWGASTSFSSPSFLSFPAFPLPTFFFLPFPPLFPFFSPPFLPLFSALRSRTHKFKLRSLKKRCKLPQRGLRRSPSRNRIWRIIKSNYEIWWLQLELFFRDPNSNF